MTDFPTLLMWANKNPKYPNSFIIKLDQQRLLGLVRTDKNGETYWKFKVPIPKSGSSPTNHHLETNPVMDQIQKFQLRQSQTEQLTNTNEPSANSTARNNSAE